MPERVFGDIPGYPEGSSFVSRAELSQAGVHRPTQAGISGSAKEGADSIVLSGGYEDDEDFGDEIIYTGHGGRDNDTGVQIAHQMLTRQNLALALNQMHGLPVRVIRGHQHRSAYSPVSGYRYDGLYRVDEHWHEPGRAGFEVWRFRLLKLTDTAPLPNAGFIQATSASPERRQTRTLRIVRDTAQARRVKELYDYCCQMCGVRLEGAAGPYAEAAHIRPLGRPHGGPDTIDNILCLCPNHHVLFDLGSVAIADDLTLRGEDGTLTVHPQHHINHEHLRYHREHYGLPLYE